jgi:hypothetical protein
MYSARTCQVASTSNVTSLLHFWPATYVPVLFLLLLINPLSSLRVGNCELCCVALSRGTAISLIDAIAFATSFLLLISVQSTVLGFLSSK